MLEYDNSAFYYFSITLLVLYLVPGTYYAIAEFIRAFLGAGSAGTRARTSEEQEKANRIKQASTGWGRLRRPVYIANLIAVVICWLIFIYLINLVKNDGEVSTFDPFTILGIDQQAPMAQIKKAYRTLSLKYHPDKNKDNKKAEEMFMKVAKAYEALTDETAKENYEKYGNPDGKQALEVSIGLPKILLENPKVVLILYLIGMVVVIPVSVGLWYANSKQYGENNVKNLTYHIIYKALREFHGPRHMADIVAASEECQTINVPKPANKECISKLYGKIQSDMLEPQFKAEVVLTGNLLLHAHLLRRRDLLNEDLRKNLDIMLAKCPDIVDGVIYIASNRRWLDTTLAAIRFSQYVVQGLSWSNDPLEQLPHVTDSIATQIKAGKHKSLVDFLRTNNEDKSGLSSLSSEQQGDIYKACKLFPVLKVDHRFFVEEEEDVESGLPEQIYEQDLVTLRVSFTRENITEGSKAGPVYAPRFPKTFHESWWLILSDKHVEKEGKQKSELEKTMKSKEVAIHAIEKVSEQTRVVKHDLKFMAPQAAGEYDLELRVVCDSYIGLDVTIPIKLVVKPASELPEYTAHPEDIALDNEPTLFEQMMAANADDDSSDDDDDEKEKADQKNEINLNKKSVIYEEDDDDD